MMLTQRVELFDQTETSTDGMLNTVYTRTGTWWGREEFRRVPENTVADAGKSDQNVVVAVRLDANPTESGALRVNSRIYKITGIAERLNLREKHISGVRDDTLNLVIP